MSKESFKVFAKSHPELASYVNKGEISWQGLYDMYDIYGERSNVWNKYFVNKSSVDTKTSFKDIIDTIKNVDLDSVQKGIQNLQKTIGLIEGLGLGKAASDVKEEYQERPMYKYFED